MIIKEKMTISRWMMEKVGGTRYCGTYCNDDGFNAHEMDNYIRSLEFFGYIVERIHNDIGTTIGCRLYRRKI